MIVYKKYRRNLSFHQLNSPSLLLFSLGQTVNTSQVQERDKEIKELRDALEKQKQSHDTLTLLRLILESKEANK